ncbi:MAG: nucleotide-binding protein [Nitrospira sp.]|nr:nucleotide-binding protein [Nitrospira sp.]
MIKEIQEDWPDDKQAQIHSGTQANDKPISNKVFVIHGRDEGTKEKVARFLQTLGLEPVILHEQANLSRTIIEKFEDHAQVDFAVALLTPDDVGSLKDEETNLKPRARQNVIFEFGYFIGKLNRKRVCALLKGDVEKPSDYDGVLYIPWDDPDGWKMRLIKELKSAGFEVDANKAISS